MNVRLETSATNRQPWFFSGNTKEIIVSRKKKIWKYKLLGKSDQIDIGMALYHIWLSLDYDGKTAVCDFKTAEVPEDYDFMLK